MSRNYLEAFVVLVVAAALGLFLVWPKYVDLQAVSGQIAEKNNELKSRQDFYAGLAAIAADLDNYSESFKKIDTALPDNADVPAFMSFAQAAAMQSGLAVKDVSYSGSDSGISGGVPSDDPDKPVLKKIVISMRLDGSYSDFKNFLATVERSSRLASFEVIGLQSTDETESEEKPLAAVKSPEGIDKILNFDIRLSANYY